jgi:hypothetical protein
VAGLDGEVVRKGDGRMEVTLHTEFSGEKKKTKGTQSPNIT